MMKKLMLLTTVVLTLLSLGCGAGSAADGGKGSAVEMKQDRKFVQVSAAEAQKMLAEEEGYILLDVRTPKEYADGHIPNAVNLPNETIGKEPPTILSDKEQRIFVYCRSGRRSQDAAAKLAAMGYTNIVDFGGIMDWRGDVVK